VTACLSRFDSDLFGLRVGWADECALVPAGFDLLFLRGPYPGLPHPQATLMDVRLDLEAPRAQETPSGLRAATAEDFLFAQGLAADAFAAHSRFFADPRLRGRAPELYRRWVLGAQARADLYALPERGFLCVSRTPDALRLDLLAVAPAWRRTGTGTALVRGFLGLRGAQTRRVKVEAGNVAALNLYLRCGFQVAAAESVQHLWRSSVS
jgi:GNAT superfamily N-acetyltransferase